MDYIGGQPYLVHLLLYPTARCSGAMERFWGSRTAGDGIFRDHLNHFLKRFQKDSRLARAMRNVIKGKGCRDVALAERLEAAGLARRKPDGEVVCCCALYREFFGKEL